MASRYFNTPRCIGPERVCLMGSFDFVASGTPTAIRGKGFTVVRTSAGLYTITFEDQFVEQISFTHGLSLSAAAALWTQGGAFNSTNKTQVLNIINATAVLTDPAVNAANRAHFTCWFRNSGAS